eukprot:CAMPEP_0206468638 /NCGR_PEP_ID=MMETSP0324_2-20121206/29755_1 /ASSEMBLY_ACC=CAM_ASM_000836 /TAXON_ID=2866 /ORGANISM="Crypthecodinium cohnii, Strain Seligo" /LENGTH=160 /DNA_ID=CAMNT_0053942147 /DNA_START=852 /DNA_END=1332 /DNA_ORIENTATION=+
MIETVSIGEERSAFISVHHHNNSGVGLKVAIWKPLSSAFSSTRVDILQWGNAALIAGWRSDISCCLREQTKISRGLLLNATRSLLMATPMSDLEPRGVSQVKQVSSLPAFSGNRSEPKIRPKIKASSLDSSNESVVPMQVPHCRQTYPAGSPSAGLEADE